MSKEKTNAYPIPDRWSYLWLAIGALLSLVSTGKWNIGVAAWLGAVFMLRFVRTQKPLRGLILAWLGIYVPSVIAWWGIIPLPVPVSLVILAMGTLSGVGTAYLADRLLVPRIKGFAATLVFPLALTAADFLGTTSNPIGSFGSAAYALSGNLVLLQLLSITGMWGITFLVSWFASVVNWAWERSFDWPAIRRGAAIYAGILLLVLAYGSARLVFSPVQAGTVRVAGLTTRGYDQPSTSDRDAFRQWASDLRERYLEQTIREAQAGAKIVLWPEGANAGFEEDEAALIARGKEVAAQQGIYLAMTPYTLHDDPGRLPDNKIIVVDPAGEVVLEHYKYGAGRLEGIEPGDGILRTVETPFGVLSGLVCWDADFPATVRQAGRNGTDILMVPSNDDRAADPMHTHMAVYRAIENGVSLVRQVSNGLSIVTDPYGRVLASMDHFSASEWVMVTQVPTQGVFTVYSAIGDLFGWLAVAGFVAVVAWGIVAGVRRRRAARTEPS